MSAFGNRTVPLCGRCSEFLLAVFLRGDYYLVIGLEVLLLIKIHCEYIFIMKGLLIFAYFPFYHSFIMAQNPHHFFTTSTLFFSPFFSLNFSTIPPLFLPSYFQYLELFPSYPRYWIYTDSAQLLNGKWILREMRLCLSVKTG